MTTGCYNNIDLDNYKNDKMADLLVVNSILTPDSTIKVVATHPFFFSDIHPRPNYVKDLAIELAINGEFVQTLTYHGDGEYYSADIHPKEGDIVELSTICNGKEIKASDLMPHRIPIESFKVTLNGPYPIYWTNDYVANYEITFTDPVNEENYYFLEFGKDSYGYDPGWGGFIGGEKVYEDEYVFQILADLISGSIPGWKPYNIKGLPFSDKGIDGTTYTLRVSEIHQDSRAPEHYPGLETEVKLYSISKNYYQSMVSLLINDPDEDGIHGSFLGFGMIEPERIYTNVEGGGGILGGYVFDTATTIILDGTAGK